VADQQQPPVLADPGQSIAGIGPLKRACKRRMDAQAPALLLAPAGGRQLRRLPRPDLGAEEHLLEARAQAREGDARCARLRLAPLREPSLSVGASPVRLGLGVPQ